MIKTLIIYFLYLKSIFLVQKQYFLVSFENEKYAYYNAIIFIHKLNIIIKDQL